MSDTNTQVAEANAVPEIQLPSIAITRNGTSLALSQYKIVKGDRKNAKYLAPTITKENFQTLLNWYGVDNVVSILQRNAKAVFQGIFFDAYDEKTGEWLQEKFTTEAARFDVAGLKLKEINDQLDEATERQVNLMAAPLDANGQFDPEVTKQMLVIRDQIAALRAMKEEKSRKPSKSENQQAEPAVQVV